MGKRYLLDANAVIDYVGDRLPAASAARLDALVNEELNTSSIVKIEVLGFGGELDEMQQLAGFLSLATIYDIGDDVADKTIELRTTYRKLKLGDALIAATALVHGFTLISRNVRDFRFWVYPHIDGLACIDPHDM